MSVIKMVSYEKGKDKWILKNISRLIVIGILRIMMGALNLHIGDWNQAHAVVVGETHCGRTPAFTSSLCDFPGPFSWPLCDVRCWIRLALPWSIPAGLLLYMGLIII